MATPMAWSDLWGPHAAQGRQRHSGGFGIRRGFLSETRDGPWFHPPPRHMRASRKRRPDSMRSPDARPRVSAGFLFAERGWPAKSARPRPPRPASRAIRRLRSRRRRCPAAIGARGRRTWIPGPLVLSSHSMARAWARAPSRSGGQKRGQRGHPGALVDARSGAASRHRRAARREATRGRARRPRSLRRTAGPGRRSGRFGPRTAPNVGPPAIGVLFLSEQDSIDIRINWQAARRASFRLSGRNARRRLWRPCRRHRSASALAAAADSNMTSVTPAPSQIALELPGP